MAISDLSADIKEDDSDGGMQKLLPRQRRQKHFVTPEQ